jgi:hypothetical protein
MKVECVLHFVVPGESTHKEPCAACHAVSCSNPALWLHYRHRNL